jgi:hypothetical protein
MNALGSFYSMMLLIKPKNITTISTTQINHLGEHSKRQYYWMRNKEQYVSTLSGDRRFWIGLSRLSTTLSPDPSLLKATSKLSFQWPGR